MKLGSEVSPCSRLLLGVLVSTGGALPSDQVGSDAAPSSLKLLISVERPDFRAPFPARVTLHFHNAGKETLWLYRRARDRSPRTHLPSAERREGPALTVHLEPSERADVAEPARASVFEPVGLPKPRLVRVPAGEDYEEKAVLGIEPARLSAEAEPLWGVYRLAISYAAKYSNAEEIRRASLGVWQGEARSNTIELRLEPPPVDARGSAAGTVIGTEKQPIPDLLVSLSDEQERIVGQVRSDRDGRFWFHRLPLGLYWVTVRRTDVGEDTAVFRHVELSEAAPEAGIEFVMLRREIFEAEEMLHKPVLLRVADGAGRPVEKASFEITWSSGKILESVKGESLADGTALFELLPGRNFITLKPRGCAKQEHRLEVAKGEGIEAVQLVAECGRE